MYDPYIYKKLPSIDAHTECFCFVVLPIDPYSIVVYTGHIYDIVCYPYYYSGNVNIIDYLPGTGIRTAVLGAFLKVVILDIVHS